MHINIPAAVKILQFMATLAEKCGLGSRLSGRYLHVWLSRCVQARQSEKECVGVQGTIMCAFGELVSCLIVWLAGER